MLDPTKPIDLNGQELVRGWDAISKLADVSPKTARKHAARNRDPLPVFVDHKGPVANVVAIREWVIRQRVPYYYRALPPDTASIS